MEHKAQANVNNNKQQQEQAGECLDAAEQLEEDELRLELGEHLLRRVLLLDLEQLLEELAALRAASRA